VVHGEAQSGDDLSFGELMAAPAVDLVQRSDDDLAVLVFTSGTAGSPKAAMLTHGNLLASIEQVISLRGDGGNPSDVTLGVLPLFHIFGLNVVLGAALRAGASIVLIERFDPMSAIEAIQRHGVTVLAGAPTMWSSWAAMPELPPDAFATVGIATSG